MNQHFSPRHADLYDTVEALTANPPQSWSVIKDEQSDRRFPWALVDFEGLQHGRFQTKREATAAKEPGGWYHDRYQQEMGWFAGVTPAGWKSYAAVQAEREEQKVAEARRLAAAERKITRQGISLTAHTAWSKALEGDDPAAIRRAAADMFEHLSSGLLLMVDQLDREEAAVVCRDLSDSYGFGTAAWDWLNQIKYLGLHEDKTAVEVLEMMDREDQDARRLDIAGAF